MTALRLSLDMPRVRAWFRLRDMTDADWLRERITAMNTSQTALARDLGVDERTVRRWAAGQEPVPKIARLALAEARAAVQGAPGMTTVQTQPREPGPREKARRAITTLHEAGYAGLPETLVLSALYDLHQRIATIEKRLAEQARPAGKRAPGD